MKNLSLLSAGICIAGYLGLALTHTYVRSALGLLWSLLALAGWGATLVIALRRHGSRGLWLLFGAPVVLLPFYAIFFAAL
jgi:hypothetical protein